MAGSRTCLKRSHWGTEMKPKVAFFDFASCEGCQLQVVNLEEELLGLLEIVEVVSFREAMKEHRGFYG